MKKINWFWKLKRNKAPLFADLFMKGLNGKAFDEVLIFPLKSQAMIGDKNNSADIYYNEDDIEIFYESVFTTIKKNKNFVSKFEEILNKIFLDLDHVSRKIVKTDLSKLSNKEISDLFKKFVDKFTCGPIITIQLFALEAFNEKFNDLRSQISSKKNSTI